MNTIATRPNSHNLAQARIWIGVAVLLITFAGMAGGELSPDRVEEIAKLLPTKPAGFGSPITDRAANSNCHRISQLAFGSGS